MRWAILAVGLLVGASACAVPADAPVVEFLAVDLPGEEQLAAAPVLEPDAIPVARVLRTLDAARRDPAYAATVPGLTLLALAGPPTGGVELVELAQFAAIDLLVFRVRAANVGPGPGRMPGADALLLEVGGRRVPVTAWVGLGGEIPVGAAAEGYLFVQGLRLSRANAFTLRVEPAQASP